MKEPGRGRRAQAPAEGKKRTPGEVTPEPKVKGGPRIPSIFMVPVGLAVGYFVAWWPGAIFGGIIGIFLWRSRA